MSKTKLSLQLISWLLHSQLSEKSS